MAPQPVQSSRSPRPRVLALALVDDICVSASQSLPDCCTPSSRFIVHAKQRLACWALRCKHPPSSVRGHCRRTACSKFWTGLEASVEKPLLGWTGKGVPSSRLPTGRPQGGAMPLLVRPSSSTPLCSQLTGLNIPWPFHVSLVVSHACSPACGGYRRSALPYLSTRVSFPFFFKSI
jgi:hypothetical protein